MDREPDPSSHTLSMAELANCCKVGKSAYCQSHCALRRTGRKRGSCCGEPQVEAVHKSLELWRRSWALLGDYLSHESSRPR